MTKPELQSLVTVMARAITEYVAEQVAPLRNEIAKLEQRLERRIADVTATYERITHGHSTNS